jgi:putative restriction endonuclease
VSLAWEVFGPMNGVGSLAEMRRRIEYYRRDPARPGDDYTIGNIILQETFFFHSDYWIPVPDDFSGNVVQGKTYDLDSGSGREIAAALEDRLHLQLKVSDQESLGKGVVGRMYSDPVLARRRLGQRGFRVLVTDTYGRQCAITREHTLPVLEAAHIRPVSAGGEHLITNGLLLRSDVHTLFDRGYVTVTPDFRFRVSKRLNSDWRNGKVYYQLENQEIHLPRDKRCLPEKMSLEWHADSIFLK